MVASGQDSASAAAAIDGTQFGVQGGAQAPGQRQRNNKVMSGHGRTRKIKASSHPINTNGSYRKTRTGAVNPQRQFPLAVNPGLWFEPRSRALQVRACRVRKQGSLPVRGLQRF